MLAGALGNDLQAAALSLRPQLADVLKAGRAAGALAGIVSGSGPTCVFLAYDAAEADMVASCAGVRRRLPRGPHRARSGAGARVV